MEKIYYIENTIDEFNTSVSGYFPTYDEAFEALKELVKRAKSKKATVMISGTNGRLLDILQQKALTEKYADAFGYIVPDFKAAIQQTISRLSKVTSI